MPYTTDRGSIQEERAVNGGTFQEALTRIEHRNRVVNLKIPDLIRKKEALVLSGIPAYKIRIHPSYCAVGDESYTHQEFLTLKGGN